MIQLREQYWAVEVPEDAKDFALHHLGDIQKLVFTSAIQDPLGCGGDMTILGPGTWEIICTSKEATEEQAACIVQVISNGKISGRPQYLRYDRDPVKDMPARSWTRDARHALETLLASKRCDLNKNWLILKKQ